MNAWFLVCSIVFRHQMSSINWRLRANLRIAHENALPFYGFTEFVNGRIIAKSLIDPTYSREVGLWEVKAGG